MSKPKIQTFRDLLRPYQGKALRGEGIDIIVYDETHTITREDYVKMHERVVAMTSKKGST